ncbi:aspartate 1-decarboxylase autocleavage activator PanM [Pantoea sp. 1.19]|uniref:aspartate 1-decarboxylase autocleavage activator PanM n=1 Tax=Pantoea sp. 1.19 TaxID=1925589 RepID=UPI000948B00D|nr:aspartate 1-decarboxylase autocleavage activator PanM [Pantoea sp. 1.19]
MKLTIVRLTQPSEQDRCDLAKIWPDAPLQIPQLDDATQLWAARFNDRLLAAVIVNLDGERGRLMRLRVREVTRRRGVGQYLLQEVIAHHSSVRNWLLSAEHSEDPAALTGFMQHNGFQPTADGWQRRL